METIGSLGIQLLLAVIMFAVILIPAFLVDKIGDHFKSEKRPEGLGCLPQVVIFVLLVAVMFALLDPAKRALLRGSCEGADDYQSCVNGDDYSDVEYDRR